ncbi:RyR domain-containing protein [Deinococcus sp. UR1]|uniref:RyR domain-containing protein n=1 Tax=Deinococcus sp. UR1 TaxID=1704277 RepID=UPI000C173D62|nr:RyR domain-containing protein [Deinococcus sp. UR1]PIG96888.1 hypothetical protein AMD26_015280 [Deinococcus sp. UR1]
MTSPAPVQLSDDRLDLLAATAHELNRKYRMSIGESADPHWEDVSPEMRRSTLLGVRGALSGNTPEQQHELWRATRIADGWVHGPVKDTEFRTHPALVPYSELPREQRLKDTLFRNVVLAVAQAFEWWS